MQALLVDVKLSVIDARGFSFRFKSQQHGRFPLP
jgi:hypothetical protein